MSDKAELMEKVMDTYDVQFRPSYSGWQSVRCPNDYGHANGDKNPSARLNLTLGGFACHGCEMRGDAYSVVMQMEGVDFVAAKEMLGGVEVAASVGGDREYLI